MIAGVDFPNSLRQHLLARRFRHEARGPHPDRFRGDFRVVERREYENWRLREPRPNEKKAVKAGDARKHEIEQNKIEAFAVWLRFWRVP